MTYQQIQQLIDDKARDVFASFNANERVGVRFGMFPAGKMQAAEADLKASGVERHDVGRLLASALMACR